MENEKVIDGFENLQYSDVTNWHASHPGYRLLYYKGIEVSQVIGALQVLNPEFFAQFDTIVEIGSYFGGLSLWINDRKKPETLFVSYDIDASLNKAIRTGTNINFRIKDCFSDEGKKEIIEFIQRPGKTLLICDGGNKNQEFIYYSEFLKSDDVIILHDFSLDEESFKYFGEYWQWPYGNESQYQVIEVAIKEKGLKQIDNFEDFLSVFWGAYVK
jgi:hypothetical protein